VRFDASFHFGRHNRTSAVQLVPQIPKPKGLSPPVTCKYTRLQVMPSGGCHCLAIKLPNGGGRTVSGHLHVGLSFCFSCSCKCASVNQ
jgi:hypothetical protein